MMFFEMCDGCGKRKFYITRRRLFVKQINKHITSKSELCGACYRRIKTMLQLG